MLKIAGLHNIVHRTYIYGEVENPHKTSITEFCCRKRLLCQTDEGTAEVVFHWLVPEPWLLGAHQLL